MATLRIINTGWLFLFFRTTRPGYYVEHVFNKNLRFFFTQLRPDIDPRILVFEETKG